MLAYFILSYPTPRVLNLFYQGKVRDTDGSRYEIYARKKSLGSQRVTDSISVRPIINTLTIALTPVSLLT